MGALAAPREVEVGGLVIRLQAEAVAAEAKLAACASAGTVPVTATVTVQTCEKCKVTNMNEAKPYVLVEGLEG